jgi:hypothetical protein
VPFVSDRSSRYRAPPRSDLMGTQLAKEIRLRKPDVALRSSRRRWDARTHRLSRWFGRALCLPGLKIGKRWRRPANTIMQVLRFIDPDWLVELEADAVVEKESGTH